MSPEAKKLLFQKVLANDAVEQVVEGPLESINLEFGDDYRFRAIVVPLRENLGDAALEKLSRDGQLSLSLAEMRTIQQHFPGRPVTQPMWNWRRLPKPGRNTVRTRRSRAASSSG